MLAQREVGEEAWRRRQRWDISGAGRWAVLGRERKVERGRMPGGVLVGEGGARGWGGGGGGGKGEVVVDAGAVGGVDVVGDDVASGVLAFLRWSWIFAR